MAGNSLRFAITSLLIFLWAGFFVPERAFAQSPEDLLKCGYIEKFTHFIDWKSNPANNDSVFRIAVIGSKKFSLALEEVFRNTKVKEKPVVVSNIKSVEEINNNLIVVISESVSENKLDEILNYTTGKPILTIGEKTGYGLKGVVINMIPAGDVVRYEINRVSLGKSKLKMSSLFVKTATLVGAPGGASIANKK